MCKENQGPLKGIDPYSKPRKELDELDEKIYLAAKKMLDLLSSYFGEGRTIHHCYPKRVEVIFIILGNISKFNCWDIKLVFDFQLEVCMFSFGLNINNSISCSGEELSFPKEFIEKAKVLMCEINKSFGF